MGRVKPEDEKKLLRGGAGVDQIEGLRVGDILHFSLSITERDQVLGGKVQTAMVLLPKPLNIGFGRARMVWPSTQPLQLKSLVDGVDLAPKEIAGGYREVSIALPIAKLAEVPKNIPSRFEPQPMIYATDFSGWSEVSSVMAPLFDPTGTIPEGSELAKVTDAIAREHKDPVERMAAALRTVQSDVRYLLVAMGSGNYTPQAPLDTWAKRYGDCKAKTLLLLAMLQRLGITAEPVLASSTQGDRLPDMLPAPEDFDHVFVRAEIAGESFWLDGTNLGSRLADIRNVPRLGHVLPLRTAGAALVALPLRADARPSPDIALVYDATTSVHLPMPFDLTVTYAGAEAERINSDIVNGGDPKLKELSAEVAKTWTDSDTVLKPRVAFDPEAATLTLRIAGIAYPDWNYRDGRFELERPASLRVDFDPDRSKSAWKPFSALIDRPWTAHEKVTLRLPPQAAEALVEGTEPFTLDSPAVSYLRTIERDGATIVEDITSRESGAEVPSKDISALRRATGDLSDTRLRISLPESYPLSWQEVAQVKNPSGSGRSARCMTIASRRIRRTLGGCPTVRGSKSSCWSGTKPKSSMARRSRSTRSPASMSRASNVRETKGDSAGSLADAQAAYDIDSSNDDARTQLAYALADSDRVDEALDLLEASPDVGTDEGLNAVLLRREHPLARPPLRGFGRIARYRAAAAAQLGRFAQRTVLGGALANTDLPSALDDCDRAVELSAETADYLDSRAMVHFRSGEMEEALADLDPALELSPGIPASHFMRGPIAGAAGQGRQGRLAGGAGDVPGDRRLLCRLRDQALGDRAHDPEMRARLRASSSSSAPIGFQQRAGDRQAEAGAALFALAGEEGVEDPLAVGGRNAGAVVRKVDRGAHAVLRR